MLSDRRGVRLAELTALWGMAASQPLLGILGDNTEFFIQNGVRGSSILVFAVALSFLVPAGVWGLEMALWRVRPVADVVHLSVLGILCAVTVAQVVKFEVGLRGVGYVLAAAAVAVCVAALWRRFSVLRTWVRWLAVVPVIAVVLFVATSPAGRYARAGSGSAGADKVTDVPIVMVMFDEFPLATLMDGSGGIDEVRFPNFARLAAGSTWYRMYSSQLEQTRLAVPSTLTGTVPSPDSSPTYVDHQESLFSLLGASHEVRALESVTQMCPPAVCTEAPPTSRNWSGLLAGVRKLMIQRVSTEVVSAFDGVADVPEVAADVHGGNSSTVETTDGLEINDRHLASVLSQRRVFEEWITTLKRQGRPTFDYAHVLLPHQPWLFSSDGSSYVNPRQPEWDEENYTKYSQWQISVRQARHTLQVQMVDALIGRLIDQMKLSGLYDDALLVVTADHGAAFMQGYHLRGVMGDYANSLEVMSVPLFVKEPGQTIGSVNDANVQTVDFLPIIAEAAGFAIPWTVSGAAPNSDSYDPMDTKLMRFPVESHGRPAGGHNVVMRDFAAHVWSSGFAGVPSDPLARLYRETPHDGLRGRLVSGLAGARSQGEVVLDADIASVPGRVLLRGRVTGIPSSAEWIAVSSRGRVVGLAPVRRNGRFETVVVESDGSPVVGAKFHLIESGRLRELSES